MSKERRIRPRVDFTSKVTVQSSPETLCKGSLKDLSMSGVYVSCAQPLPLDTRAVIRIELNCGEMSESIEAHGKVMRREASSLPAKTGGMGLHFTVLKPDDAIKLFRCIRFQSEQPPKLELENVETSS